MLLLTGFQRKMRIFAKVVKSQKTYAKKVMNYLLLNQPDYGHSLQTPLWLEPDLFFPARPLRKIDLL